MEIYILIGEKFEFEYALSTWSCVVLIIAAGLLFTDWRTVLGYIRNKIQERKNKHTK